MKPFDLEKAKAGEPVVTRDGNDYLFGKFNPDAVSGNEITGWINGVIYAHNANGKVYRDYKSDYDLFMAPTKHRREVFTNHEGIVMDYDAAGKTPPSNLWLRATIEWGE